MITIKRADLVLGKDYTQRKAIAVDPENDASMEPLIPRHAKVIVVPGEPCPHGKVVIAVMPDLHIAIFRTLLIERGPGGVVRKILRASEGADQDRELHEDAGDWCWRASHALIEL